MIFGGTYICTMNISGQWYGYLLYVLKYVMKSSLQLNLWANSGGRTLFMDGFDLFMSDWFYESIVILLRDFKFVYTFS